MHLKLCDCRFAFTTVAVQVIDFLVKMHGSQVDEVGGEREGVATTPVRAAAITLLAGVQTSPDWFGRLVATHEWTPQEAVAVGHEHPFDINSMFLSVRTCSCAYSFEARVHPLVRVHSRNWCVVYTAGS